MLMNVDWEQRIDWERLRKYRVGRIVDQMKKRVIMLNEGQIVYDEAEGGYHEVAIL